ncbi:excinuclease ABC subunit UvrC [Mycetocola zhadangensis]|uniref:UvrABC system protein C n=1 Tax=Mycetocola zhadangensis TaxID=1164595 RepID=A0A3L7J657_9MICO|nr:excinuclease ABC subunit UvrC [Mycetocola zhadangensis]RLQ86198.1 excinuclease ABC subunit UvrC [Mycetocola zhadangensis]GGE89207.1 UvrABC system protein C [Mycetocola zhadangensis]
MAPPLSYRPKPGEIPTTPGVYRFRDENSRVLYVGKAKNLRARLSNYFAPLRTLHERTRRMVTTASSVEWTVVGSDIEALQLEYTWIKEFDPPFNVKFRDDKTYPYMAITLGDEAPRVLVTRNPRIKGAKYFGPYPKIWAVHDTIDLMIKAFPIRTCSDSSYKRATQSGKPCFPGQIGRCGGPCSGKVTLEEHRAMVNDFISFMAGNDRRFVTDATKKMKEAAAAQDYESAARYRDRLQALEAVLEKSAVVLNDSVDADLFGVEHDELSAAVQQFLVRGGRIRGVRSWTVDKELDLSTAELVDSILQRAYDGAATEVPKEVIVPELPEDAAELETWLAEIRGKGRVKLKTAQRGEKAALMQTANVNAKNALQLYKMRRTADFVARSQALTDIQEAIGMEQAPLRIECYDVSHLSGTNIVASMVVFEDGLARKDHYRRFSIPSSTDDTDSIYQVLTRRLAYLREPETVEPTVDPTTDEVVADDVKRKKFAYPPQLLIVDGGQPQVQAAQRALVESGRTDIQLVGMAKRLEEIWLPDNDYPVILPRNSEALFLLQRARDEAHRFAITYQRTKRKRDIASVLTEIPGLGPARVKALLVHFGSVAAMRDATPDDIAAVKGVGPALAQTIADTLSSRAGANSR